MGTAYRHTGTITCWVLVIPRGAARDLLRLGPPTPLLLPLLLLIGSLGRPKLKLPLLLALLDRPPVSLLLGHRLRLRGSPWGNLLFGEYRPSWESGTWAGLLLRCLFVDTNCTTPSFPTILTSVPTKPKIVSLPPITLTVSDGRTGTGCNES